MKSSASSIVEAKLKEVTNKEKNKKSLTSIKALVEDQRPKFSILDIFHHSYFEQNSEPIFLQEFGAKEFTSYQQDTSSKPQLNQAVAVVTDSTCFNGSDELIQKFKETVSSTTPIVRKDIIVDEYQVFESAYLGADSFILYASLLDLHQLQYYTEIGRDLGMECLIFNISEQDLDKTLQTDAKIVGVSEFDILQGTKTSQSNVVTLLNKVIDTDPTRILVSDCIRF